MYREYLVQEGYAPKIDSDGDVIFKYEGLTYIILISEDDDEYFQMMALFWDIESAEERRRAHSAALEISKNLKVVKLVPYGDDSMSAAVEMFCVPPEAFKPVFGRSASAIRVAIRQFAEKMDD